MCVMYGMIPGLRWPRYNPNDPRYDEQHRMDVEATVSEAECIEQEEPRRVPLTPSQTIAAEALNGEIEMVEVQNSVISLSNGKAPGSDGIVSEILKKGRLSMIKCLHALCSHHVPSRKGATRLAAWCNCTNS